jgi:hypothetical protein
MLPHRFFLEDAAGYAHKFAMPLRVHYVPLTKFTRFNRILKIDGEHFGVARLASVKKMDYSVTQPYIDAGLIPAVRTSLPEMVERRTEEFLVEAFSSGKLKMVDFLNGRLGQQVLGIGQGPAVPWGWQHMHVPLRDPNSNAFIEIMREEARQRPLFKSKVLPILNLWEGLNPDLDHYGWAVRPSDYGITIFPPAQWESPEHKRLWAYNYHWMMDRSGHGVGFPTTVYSQTAGMSNAKVEHFFAQWHRRFDTTPLYPRRDPVRHGIALEVGPFRRDNTDPIDPDVGDNIVAACWYNAVAFAALGFLPTVHGMKDPFADQPQLRTWWARLRKRMKRGKSAEFGFAPGVSSGGSSGERWGYGVIKGAVMGSSAGPWGAVAGAFAGAAMGTVGHLFGGPSPGDLPDITWWHPQWTPVPYPLAQIGTKAGPYNPPITSFWAGGETL